MILYGLWAVFVSENEFYIFYGRFRVYFGRFRKWDESKLINEPIIY